MSRDDLFVAIIGAGPCGLACARELAREGHREWRVFEREAAAGGNAASVVDAAGFTWDLGGHVVFSHYGEFDRLLDEVMGPDVQSHERSSYIRFGDRWVPYPFQNNLRHLPPHAAYECLVGLVEARGGAVDMDFGTWMESTFGAGITRHFMRPYNLKVWATPPEDMSATWIAERVSVVGYERALRGVVFEEDDVGWGPNNTFKFPSRGGTGEIYRRLAARLGEGVAYHREVVEVDVASRLLRFSDGGTAEYDVLVSTMPVDLLVRAIKRCPSELRAAAGRLRHSGVWAVGVGYERALEDDRSWMYFPEPAVPFYRATNFAKYAAANVPGGDTGRYCSYLTETSYSPSHVDGDGLEERVVEGISSCGLVDRDAHVASINTIDIGYAYPTPTRDRDRALGVIQPWLLQHGIYSRGRFGTWRYEVGNMDHAVKMGVEVARLILEGRPEELWTL